MVTEMLMREALSRPCSIAELEAMKCIHHLLLSPFEVRRRTLPFSLVQSFLLTRDYVADRRKKSLLNIQAVASLY